MTTKEFHLIFKRLSAAFSQSVPPETEKLYYEKLSEVDPDILQTSIGLLIETKTAMPSISSCIAMCDSVAFNVRKQLEAEERRESEEEAKRLSVPLSYSKRAFGFIDKLMSGDITRGKYVAECEAMGMNMTPLKNYYNEIGADLDGFARQGIRKRKESR